MSAQVIRRRKKTARELAEKMGVTPRTIQNYIAEERADYEGRAAGRRRQHARRPERALRPAR